jgi:hypothetical protein
VSADGNRRHGLGRGSDTQCRLSAAAIPPLTRMRYYARNMHLATTKLMALAWVASGLLTNLVPAVGSRAVFVIGAMRALVSARLLAAFTARVGALNRACGTITWSSFCPCRSRSSRPISVQIRLWRRGGHSCDPRNPGISTRSSSPLSGGKECGSAACSSPGRRHRTGRSPFDSA